MTVSKPAQDRSGLSSFLGCRWYPPCRPAMLTMALVWKNEGSVSLDWLSSRCRYSPEMPMMEIARPRSLSFALLAVSTTGAGCFRTPLGGAVSPTPADGAPAMQPALLHDLPPDLAPDLRRDASADLSPDVAPDIASDVVPDLASDPASDGEIPAVVFASVSAGHTIACGLKTNGAIACWGDNISGQATPPAGTFTSVSAGWDFACGVRTDGTITCWGSTFDGLDQPPAP